MSVISHRGGGGSGPFWSQRGGGGGPVEQLPRKAGSPTGLCRAPLTRRCHPEDQSKRAWRPLRGTELPQARGAEKRSVLALSLPPFQSQHRHAPWDNYKQASGGSERFRQNINGRRAGGVFMAGARARLAIDAAHARVLAVCEKI